MGNGYKIKFYHDVCCGDKTLKKAYPKFYGMARMKDASIVDLLIQSNITPQWNVTFFKDAQDLEVDPFLELYDLGYSTLIIRGAEDDLLAPF